MEREREGGEGIQVTQFHYGGGGEMEEGKGGRSN